MSKKPTCNVAKPNRSIADIAADITDHWFHPYYGAKPYIQAMFSLDAPTDTYGADDAESILLRFLSNARLWKGANARRIKQEINDLLATLQN